jgi:y4mF family transcriptional regulator
MRAYEFPHFPRWLWQEDFGNIVRQVRKVRGVTQEQLAVKTGTSAWFIGQMENGKATLQMDKVLLVLRFLNIGVQLVDLQERRHGENAS